MVDIKRAPKSFDSRTRCSGRRYEYIMPTYVLAPKEHIAALFEEVRLLRVAFDLAPQRVQSSQRYLRIVHVLR